MESAVVGAGLNVENGAHGVRILTLDRSERLNAVNMPMIVALEAALRDAMADPHVAVLLLRGSGRAFCAGDDVTAQADICEEGESALRLQLTLLQSISALLTMGEKPTVASVRGWAVGAGFSWVLNCDFTVWAASARAFLPEVAFGTFVTGGATWLLPNLAGSRLATDMLLRGRRITSDEALAHGLATQVVAEEELEDASRALAEELATLPQASVRYMKRALASAHSAAFKAALSQEVEACVSTTLDPGTLARMRAAVAKVH